MSQGANDEGAVDVQVNTVVRVSSTGEVLHDATNAPNQEEIPELPPPQNTASNTQLLPTIKTMLPKFEPHLTDKAMTSSNVPTDRQYDHKANEDTNVDVQKTLDEEMQDTAKEMRRKLEGQETRNVKEQQEMVEHLKETAAAPADLSPDLLVRGKMTRRRNIKQTSNLKKVVTRTEDEKLRATPVARTVEKRVDHKGKAEKVDNKNEKQEDHIEKIRTQQQLPSAL